MNTIRTMVAKAAFLLTAAMLCLSGQTVDYFTYPARGLTAGQGYELSQVETMNMSNGGLTMSVPLTSLPAGPKGSSLGVTLHYNSRYWDSTTEFAGSSSFAKDLVVSPGGGWRLSYDYELVAIEPEVLQADACSSVPTQMVSLMMYAPDGSAHKMYLKGRIMGSSCQPGFYFLSDFTTAGTTDTWYSLDGSFLRMDLPRGPYWPETGWTLHEPDGSVVTRTSVNSSTPEVTKRTDKDGNEVTWGHATINGDMADVITDSWGHQINVIHHYLGDIDIQQTGPSGSTLTWSIHYLNGAPRPTTYYIAVPGPQVMIAPLQWPELVSSIQLPERAQPDGSLYRPTFSFEYNAHFGQMSKATLPSGAVATYSWYRDPTPITTNLNSYLVEADAPTSKTVTHDGVSDTTTYSFPMVTNGIGTTSSVTAPDGGVTAYEFRTVSFYSGLTANAGEITKVTLPDGSIKGKTWASNQPPGATSGTSQYANRYVAWEYETAVGTSPLVKTKKYRLNLNGGVVQTDERAWTAYNGTITAPETGTLVRSTVNMLHYALPDAGSTTDDQYLYMNVSAPAVLGLPDTVETRDAAGTVLARTSYHYDNNTDLTKGNPTRVGVWDFRPSVPGWTAVERISSFTYDTRGRALTSSDADGVTTTRTYTNCSGFRIYSSATPSIGTETYTHECNMGLPTGRTMPNGRVDGFGYDAVGRVVQANEGSLRRTRYAYSDAARWILSASDVNQYSDGLSTVVTYYDQLSRERLSRRPLYTGSDTSLATEGTTPAIKVNQAYETSTTRSAHYVSNPYDPQNTGDSSVGWTVTMTDLMGRPCAVENYAGIAQPSPGTCASAGSHGGRRQLSYGTVADGTLVAETTKGTPDHTKQLVTDGLGRLIRVVEDPSGKNLTTNYTYSELDHLTGVNQSDRTRSFSYNSLGSLLTAFNPESGTTSYGYTAGQRLLSKTDARSVIRCNGALSGTTCSGSFDGAGRVLQTSYSDGTPSTTWSYEYDRVHSVTNSNATLTYGYDVLDRVTSRQQQYGQSTYTQTATYVPAGIKTETLAGGRVITWNYSMNGQMSSVAGSRDGNTTTYATVSAFAPNLQPKAATLGNGVAQTWAWDYRGQLQSVTAGSLFSVSYRYCGANGTSCSDYDGNLRRQNLNHLNAYQEYAYDTLSRITQAKETITGQSTAGWTRNFDYDAWGNGWTVLSGSSGLTVNPSTPIGSANFNSQNRLGINGSGYDAAGNQTAIAGFTNAFDGEGHLKSSILAGTTTQYLYDGEGRRVKKVMPSRTVTYVYSVTGDLSSEFDTQGTGEGTQYLLADALGSTRQTLNSVGVSTHCFDYLPFGEEIPQGVNGRGSCYASSVTPTVKFTGKERDAETGLDYFGARYSSSAQGRFTSSDQPFADQHPENPQSWNLYTYTLNNPLRYVDPDGEGVIDGVSRWVDRTGGAFVSLVLEPDRVIPQAAGNAWNAVTHPGQTLSNIGAGIQNFMNSSTDDKITTLTGVALDVGVIAITGGASRASSPTTLSELPALANAQNAMEATAAVASSKTATVVGAYDVKTGAVAVGKSGEGLNPLNSQISAAAQKAGGLGTRNPGVPGAVGNCAECGAANKLANQGSNVNNVRFTQATRPRTGEVIKKCPNCEVMFPNQ